MRSGILKNWYLAQIRKAGTPQEYFLAVSNYILYSANVFSFNIKSIFSKD